MKEKKISERESLEIITEMISRTKDRYISDGNIMLMWGYLVVAVTLAVWILIANTHNGVWNWLWFLIPIVGCTVSPFMARKNQAKSGVKSYSDKITSAIWTIASLSMIVLTLFCLVFRFVYEIDSWRAMIAYPFLIVPFAEIVQGIIVKEKSLIVGGVIGLLMGMFTLCCIAGNVALVANWFMPLFIAAFVVMMIIPGYIINSKAKRK